MEYIDVDTLCKEYLNNVNPVLSGHQNIKDVLVPLVLRLANSMTSKFDCDNQSLAVLINNLCTDYLNSSSVLLSHEQNVHQHLKPLLHKFMKHLKSLPPFHHQEVGDARTSSHSEAIVDAGKAGEIRLEGWLRKKGQHVNLWHERYFMVKYLDVGVYVLNYYRKRDDKEPRGSYILGPGCQVDEVRESPSKIESRKLFTFRLSQYSNFLEDTQQPSGDEHSSTNDVADITPNPNLSADEFVIYSPCASSHRLRDNIMEDPENKTTWTKKQKQKKKRAAQAAAAAAAATAVVLTGGLAGFAFVPMGFTAATAAAGAGVGTLIAQGKGKSSPLALAAESRETAEWWRENILECIAEANEHCRKYLEDQRNVIEETEQRKSDEDSFSQSLNTENLKASKLVNMTEKMFVDIKKNNEISQFIARNFQGSKSFSDTNEWKVYSNHLGLRILEEFTDSFIPCFKTSVTLRISPKKVFDLLLNTNSNFYRDSRIIDTVIRLQHLNDYSDIVYMKTYSQLQFLVRIEPRDFCLIRHWEMQEDGSFVIYYLSITHPECRPTDSYVRGEVLRQIFTIAPRKDIKKGKEEAVGIKNDSEECLLTLTSQVDPQGWILSLFKLKYSFGLEFIKQIVEIKEIVNLQMFEQVNASVIDDHQQEQLYVNPLFLEDLGNMSSKNNFMRQETIERPRFPRSDSFASLMASLPSSLPRKYWSEPSARNFRVRGKSYMEDSQKILADYPVFSLEAIDLYETPVPIQNISSKPELFVHQLAKRSIENSPFVFVVNFIIPATQFYSFALYFVAPSPSILSDGSGFVELCMDFFDGDDDDFRDNRLKIIPAVVEGSWMVRSGLGDIPTILGNKVEQRYYRGSNYFEVSCDIMSSSVASGIVRLLLGQVENLVIDLAFVLEGKAAEELPEKVLGCARINHVDLACAKQLS